jgi:hypothetical protein
VLVDVRVYAFGLAVCFARPRLDHFGLYLYAVLLFAASVTLWCRQLPKSFRT